MWLLEILSFCVRSRVETLLNPFSLKSCRAAIFISSEKLVAFKI